MVGLMTTKQVMDRLDSLRPVVPAGHVVVDAEAGTAEAKDEDGNVVFRALQKGKGGPWIVRHTSTNCIKWTDAT